MMTNDADFMEVTEMPADDIESAKEEASRGTGCKCKECKCKATQKDD